MKLKLLASAIMMIAIIPMQANAFTKTGIMYVSAFITKPDVQIFINGSLTFGQVFAGDLGIATTSFDVVVKNAMPYSIDFGTGKNGGQGVNFLMRNATKTGSLLYGLYKSSSKIIQYSANHANYQHIQNKVGTGIAQTYTLYSEITQSNSNITADSYSDTITITITF